MAESVTASSAFPGSDATQPTLRPSGETATSLNSRTPKRESITWSSGGVCAECLSPLITPLEKKSRSKLAANSKDFVFIERIHVQTVNVLSPTATRHAKPPLRENRLWSGSLGRQKTLPQPSCSGDQPAQLLVGFVDGGRLASIGREAAVGI